jgi:hypothetical protein
MAIAAVSQDELVGFKLKAPQTLAAMFVGQFVVVTDQFGQADAVVNAPVAAGAARFAHIGRINGSDPVGLRPNRPAQPSLLLRQ